MVRRLLELWTGLPEYHRGTSIAKAIWDRERYSREMALTDDGHCRARGVIETGSSLTGYVPSLCPLLSQA